ncbi:MAG: alpha/beta hydrolase [Emcibacteraceae bacterium]|nr:alpha/beta hydrolase [Emcibacteraceae bacterium]
MSKKHLNNNNLPIILIHGSFANAKSWRKIKELGEFGNQTITVNLPGHGGLNDPIDFEKPSFETEFTEIKSQINYKGEPVHFVGHSYGGVVALAAALSESFNVAKLTLFEPVAISVTKTFNDLNSLNIIEEFVKDYHQAAKTREQNACSRVINFWGGKGSFEMIPHHIQDAMTVMTRNNLRHWDLCAEQFSPDLYKNLNISIDIAYGSQSNTVAKSIAKILFNILPNAQIHEIKGASHFMITSHPNECVKILLP